MDWFLLVLIIFAIFICLVIWSKGHLMYESFMNNVESNEFDDLLYTRLYNIVFNWRELYETNAQYIHDFLVKDNLSKDVNMLEWDTSLGKNYQNLHKYYPNIIGITNSQTAKNLAETLNPTGTFEKHNPLIRESFNKGEFDVVISLMESLYHVVDWQDMLKLLDNFYYWTSDGGFLMLNIFDKGKLDPSPRDFSMVYENKDDKINHALTYFEDFTHEAWWENTGSDRYQYCQKYILENGRVVIKNVKLMIPDTKRIIQYLTENKKMKLREVRGYNGLGIETFQFYVFQK